MKCPICNGSGHLDEPKKELKLTQKRIHDVVVKLKDEGFSYRQIAKKMKWNSTSVVSYYLNKKIK